MPTAEYINTLAAMTGHLVPDDDISGWWEEHRAYKPDPVHVLHRKVHVLLYALNYDWLSHTSSGALFIPSTATVAAPTPESLLTYLAHRNEPTKARRAEVPQDIASLVSNEDAEEQMSQLIAQRPDIVNKVREIRGRAQGEFADAKVAVDSVCHDDSDCSLALVINVHGEFEEFWSAYETFTDWLVDQGFDTDPDLGVLPLYLGKSSVEEVP